MANCPTTRTCKFANDRGVDVFEIDLMATEAVLLGFGCETVFWKLVTVTAACFVDCVIVVGYT